MRNVAPWSTEEMMWLTDAFPRFIAHEITPFFTGRSTKSIRRKAEEMGLKKTEEARFRSMSFATALKWKRRCFDPVKNAIALRAVMRRRDQRREKNPNWRGGERPRRVRDCVEYKKWRSSVFERDKYFCRFCGQWGRDLEAHHIKQFIHHPDLRYTVSNGITLCARCHKGIRRKEHLWEECFAALNNVTVLEANESHTA